ncbi:metal ABC transporter ATP-binding protein [Streptococcus sp. H49]|uniref:metal ABC transporter ATP-binding protein n=1 Tax=Streptococcus huangxiaojuni TaxID=3237239 RepID=UPI0034A28D1C
MIRVSHLTCHYIREQSILDDISLTLDKGKIIGIIGPNGAGKSTFIKALMGLITYSGTIEVAGEDCRQLSGKAAYVEQRSHIDFHFPITVKECVRLGIYQGGGAFPFLRKKRGKSVDAVLEELDLAAYANRPLHALSGGQFQRVMVARCLIQDRDYLFLDEPFAGIDLVSEQMIISLLKELRTAGKTIIIVHHDLSKVRAYFDQLVILKQKLLAYGPVSQVFTADNLRAAFGGEVFFNEEV